MSYPISILVPALLATAAVAAPQSIRDSFSLNEVGRGRFYKNGPAEMARTYVKYGVQVPEQLTAAAARADAAMADMGASNISERSVAASPEDSFDTLYVTPVQIGSVSLEMALDTGSADTWCFSTLLPLSLVNGQSLCNPSTGSLLAGQSWSIQYGDGSGSAGIVYSDRVVVGDVTATRQSVQAATSASSLFVQDSHSDGIMGMASSSLNSVQPNSQKTFFDTVKPQLKQPVFTAALKKGAPGQYDFGVINSSLYTGNIAYTPVLSQPRPGFWDFNATGYSVGSGNVVSTTIPSIADTGTTLWYLPPDVVAAYYKNVPGAQNRPDAGGWVIPCNKTPPSISIMIGGAAATVPGSYMIYGAIDQKNNCYGGIQDNSAVGFSIFGLVFLKSQFVVFDAGSPQRIGFAKRTGISYS